MSLEVEIFKNLSQLLVYKQNATMTQVPGWTADAAKA